MIKYFCDECDDEITRENQFDDQDLEVGNSKVELIFSSSNHEKCICLKCFTEAVKELSASRAKSPESPIPTVPTTVESLWEKGEEHDPRSMRLFKDLREIDFTDGGDFFCWKYGGDGDNGEHLMYELDIYFKRKDTENKI